MASLGKGGTQQFGLGSSRERRTSAICVNEKIIIKCILQKQVGIFYKKGIGGGGN
jgi:3-isopropylmalate dehydratase small subunit